MERTAPARKGLRTTLFVSGLPARPPTELESHLRRAFGQFEEVIECEVLRRDGEDVARGFAFVRLRDGRRTEEAKAALDGTHLLPRSSGADAPLRVRWALDTSTLHVGDLGPSVTTQVLKDAFGQFGTVVSCRVETEPTELGGAPKLCGFVEFSKRSVAAKVQQLLSDNLFLLSSSPRPVRVEFAVDPGADGSEGQPVVQGPVEPPPHFAQPGTLEFEFALKWRELALAHRAEDERLQELHRQERELLRQEQAETYQHELTKFNTLEDPRSAAAASSAHRGAASIGRPGGGVARGAMAAGGVREDYGGSSCVGAMGAKRRRQ